MQQSSKNLHLSGMKTSFCECHYRVGNIYECAPSWRWRVERMEDCDLWLVLSGRGSLETEGRTYELEYGDCFIFHPGQSLSASLDPENPLVVAAAHFTFAGGSRRLEPPLHRKLGPETGFVGELAGRAVSHAREGRTKEADYWLGAALTAIFETDAELRRIPGSLLAWRERMQRVADEIVRNPERRHDFRVFSKRLKMSYDHFARSFKKVCGRSPEDFAVESRMERARTLLLFSNCNVSEIAERLGYSSLYFFSRQFKERNGVSPRAYKARHSG